MFLATLTLAALPVAAAPATLNGGVVWHDGALSNAVGMAAKEDQLVMLYFWRDGSDYCAKLWQDTLSSDQAQSALGDVVCYSANHGTAQGAREIQVKVCHGYRFGSGVLKQANRVAGYAFTPAHIAQVLDAGVADDDYYIVMEYIEEAETLERFSNGQSLLSPVRIAELGAFGEFIEMPEFIGAGRAPRGPDVDQRYLALEVGAFQTVRAAADSG